MPVLAPSYRVAFSLNKQADSKTPVADAKINKMRPAQGLNPISLSVPNRVSDQGWAGKGHTHATFNERTSELPVLSPQAAIANDLELLFAFAHVMGSVSSVQEDALTNPNEWSHTITWQDILTLPQCRYTTLLEEFADGSAPGYRRKLSGAWLDQLTISSPVPDFVSLSWQGRGRKYATEGTATLPAAPTVAHLMKGQFATLKFGPAAAPDVSAKWTNFSLTFNRNASPKFRAGQPAGEELIVERADVGIQSVTGSITLELDNTIRGYFINDTDLEIILTLISEDVIDSNPASCRVTLPKVKVTDEGFGTEDQTVIYTATFGEGSVLKKDASTQPATVKIVTDIDNTEILVTSP